MTLLESSAIETSQTLPSKVPGKPEFSVELAETVFQELPHYIRNKVFSESHILPYVYSSF